MALPTTIAAGATRKLPKQNWYTGPFLAPNGSYYVVLLVISDETPTVWSSSDPGTVAFGELDLANNPTAGGLDTIWAYLEGTEIHVATARADGNDPEIQYHVFDTASDTWTTTDQTIDNTKNSGFEAVSIAVRSDGDIIVLYNGDAENIMGSPYDRVVYAREEGSGWTVDIDVGGTGAGNDRMSAVIVRGSGDNMHFFWHISTTGALEGRTLDPSTNGLSTTRTLAGEDPIQLPYTRGVSYDDSGTQRVIVPWLDETGITHKLEVLRGTEDGSGDLDTSLGITDVSDSGIEADQGTPVACSAVDGTTMHCTFVHGGTGDLERDTAAAPQTSWGTDITVYNSTDVWGTTCEVYVHGGRIVLAHVYWESDDTVQYDEVDLGAAPVVVGPSLRRIPRAFEVHSLAR